MVIQGLVAQLSILDISLALTRARNFIPCTCSLAQRGESSNTLKGGYLFSHLTELKYIYITEIYMKIKN